MLDLPKNDLYGYGNIGHFQPQIMAFSQFNRLVTILVAMETREMQHLKTFYSFIKYTLP